MNGRNYYKKKKVVYLWFTEKGSWVVGTSIVKARIQRDIPFPDCTTNWNWQLSNPIERRPPNWIDANKELGVKGNPLES